MSYLSGRILHFDDSDLKSLYEKSHFFSSQLFQGLVFTVCTCCVSTEMDTSTQEIGTLSSITDDTYGSQVAEDTMPDTVWLNQDSDHLLKEARMEPRVAKAQVGIRGEYRAQVTVSSSTGTCAVLGIHVQVESPQSH